MKIIEGLRRWFFGKRNEDFFLKVIDPKIVPQHVAIIMDGNGRWAAKRGLPRIAGHRAGATAIREVVEVAPKIGVKYLTFYTFSTENWQRPKDEIEGLMSLFEEILQKEIDELNRNNVQIKVIGNLEGVYPTTRDQFKRAVELTKKNTGLNLIIALNYSGRGEIIEAAKSLIKEGVDPQEVTEETFSDRLWTDGVPDPELLIRTSGELRISNFLLWQIAYTEFWITDILWPDFKRTDFLQAIYDFQKRQRRFGGLD